MTQYHCACFPLSRSPQHVGWLLILLRHVLNCLGGTKKWSRRWGVSSSRFSFLKVTFLKFLYKTSMYISLARTQSYDHTKLQRMLGNLEVLSLKTKQYEASFEKPVAIIMVPWKHWRHSFRSGYTRLRRYSQHFSN